MNKNPFEIRAEMLQLAKEFAKIIEQTLTDKTKSIWHPKLDITKNSLMRRIVDNAE